MVAKSYPTGKTLCVFLNVKDFDLVDGEVVFQPREGADVDERELQEALSPFNIEVRLWQNLTEAEIKQSMQDLKVEVDETPQSYAAFVLFAMSHGGQIHGHDFIVTKDNAIIYTSELIEPLHNEYCYGFRSKPKCFIFNSCRGSGDNIDIQSSIISRKEISTDGFEYATVSNRGESELSFKRADYMVVHSTVGGFVSFRDTDVGSAFIHALVNAITKHMAHGQKNFAEVVKLAAYNTSRHQKGGVDEVQVPEVVSTLRFDYYLEFKGNV